LAEKRAAYGALRCTREQIGQLTTRASSLWGRALYARGRTVDVESLSSEITQAEIELKKLMADLHDVIKRLPTVPSGNGYCADVLKAASSVSGKLAEARSLLPNPAKLKSVS
jgi:hypothetical protein